MKIVLIAAADEAWGIGYKGQLPWHHKEDLMTFRRWTMGKHLLIGRKTRDTLPPLSGRYLHTISATGSGDFKSVPEAIHNLRNHGLDELIIAGGAMIYHASLEHADEAEITRVKGSHPCDTFMPDLTLFNWHKGKELILSENLKHEYWKNNEKY